MVRYKFPQPLKHVLIFFLQMATLAVQEAMGMKVDSEAVATLVLPQLWAMSMGPRKYRIWYY